MEVSLLYYLCPPNVLGCVCVLVRTISFMAHSQTRRRIWVWIPIQRHSSVLVNGYSCTMTLHTKWYKCSSINDYYSYFQDIAHRQTGIWVHLCVCEWAIILDKRTPIFFGGWGGIQFPYSGLFLKLLPFANSHVFNVYEKLWCLLMI